MFCPLFSSTWKWGVVGGNKTKPQGGSDVAKTGEGSEGLVSEVLQRSEKRLGAEVVDKREEAKKKKIRQDRCQSVKEELRERGEKNKFIFLKRFE